MASYEDAPTEFKEIDPQELEKEANENIKDFEELLDTISSLHDKKKALWKQIYQNSVTDRRNAYIAFGNLYGMVHGHGSEHAIHGTTLAKYLERMNKANEQLIRLAELLDEAIEEDEEVNQDDIYERLQSHHNASNRKK